MAAAGKTSRSSVIDITVPDLGAGVEQATFTKWLKKKGETVEADELLAEVETDKATIEVRATQGGTIKTLTAKEGDSVVSGEKLGQMEGVEQIFKNQPLEICSSESAPPMAAKAEEAILVPPLGDGVDQAKFVRWVKVEGENIEKGDLIAEVETDKATIEIVAPTKGVLSHLSAQEGAMVEEGNALGHLIVSAYGSSSSLENDSLESLSDRASPPVATPSMHAEDAQTPVGDETYDLIVIGAGPGGYVCAIRAAQLGMKVACVEKRETLGGTCLNVGCIPSKALLQSSEHYHALTHDFKDHGITAQSVALDIEQMQKRRAGVVDANVKGVEYLFRKNKITWLKGYGRIESPTSVSVDGKSVQTRHIVIATGSESAHLPGIKIDEKDVVTSTGALVFNAVPKKLVVIGGGVIGVELGSVWSRLGAEVTIIEYTDHLLPGFDQEVSVTFERLLAKQGMTIKTGARVIEIEKKADGLLVQVEKVKDGAASELQADKVLVAVGRRAYTEGLGLEEVGVACDERGRVKTKAHYATNIEGVYAIGDVIAGPMLAHKAEDEGMALAEHLAGKAGHVNYDVIPSVVYTWPEVSGVGKTEETLKAEGIAYKSGKFPFTANGRARAMGMTDGFVKILADKNTDRVLGVHIVGPTASELIAEAAMAMEFEASSEDIVKICHAHPTLSEATREAALAVLGRAIHI